MDVLSHPIGKLYTELSPTGAYLEGLEEFGGQVVIPLEGWRREMLGRTTALMNSWKEPVLDAFRVLLTIEPEYPAPLDTLAELLYGYLIKDAPEKYLKQALSTISKDLPKFIKEIEKRQLTLEERVMVNVSAEYVFGTASIWKTRNLSEGTLKLLDELLGLCKDFANCYGVPELRELDCDSGLGYMKKNANEKRLVRPYYPELTSKCYGYEETPNEIVTKAKRWIEEELDNYRNAIKKLEEIGGEEAVKKEFALPVEEKELVNLVNKVRSVLADIATNYFITFPPHYDVRVTPTPEFLRPLIPSGAASGYNTLTDKPFVLYYTTPGGIDHMVDLVHLTFHEEYGHAVHMMWVSEDAELSIPRKITSTLSLPVSEGIAFHREREILELFTTEENVLKKVLSICGGDKDLFLATLRYHTLKWRIMRYIRAYADPQYNMGWKMFENVIEETTNWTGVPKEMVFAQLFNFLPRPGYAPSYSLAARLVMELQEVALKRGIRRRDFNTWVARAGYIPLPMLKEHLMSKISSST
ncbi:MAG: DUF885 family protein [Candidatus Korarchaeota archaeon]